MSGPARTRKAAKERREGSVGTRWRGGLGGKDAPLLPRARFLADGRKMYRKDYGTFHLATLSSSATLAAGKLF